MAKLPDEQRQRLQRLAALPDSEIDPSEVPEIHQIPSDAVIGKYYRPKKQPVTLRLDADLLAWLKKFGDGYQTRINPYLREARNREMPRQG